ncbi:glycosyltransferase family 2 protein [Thiopseudomonas alkaliphila]|uniref:glycosyltransferase family 2 protein n=1 Tax=Thiopseudomonas alkaliphila TaxID=1697053 RepID=UPI00069EACBB|nr:glycosyltransferase family 2 protein [Thiopseudomonas alkaliphila]AKX50699.1 glycosyl transferase [Thiopseudomonas alkaliphila]AKX57034.1 glycosyl transferase [Thiopseudomonas alkaliphila]
MLVSIITPLYNCSTFLESTIRSIIAQSYIDWELVLVDDCSQDNSLDIANDYVAQDSRIKLIKLTKNSGAAVARNIAIEEASGRLIAFLDSDDLWHPQKLEKQINFMLENNYAFSYTAYEKINEEGKVFEYVGAPQQLSYKQLLKTNEIGCLTVIYDTKHLGKVYMPTETKREDYATWLSILKKTDYAYGMPEILGQYRVYANQSSAKKGKMAKENWKLYRNIENLGVIKSAYYFSHYIIRGVLRTKLPKLARMLGVLHK